MSNGNSKREKVEQSDKDETPCYVGVRPCGCWVAATVDEPRNTLVRKDVADFMRHGLTIERKPVWEVRLKLMRCIHDQAEE